MVAELGINGIAYDQFFQHPFASCHDGALAEVSFSRTDNPFHCDKSDRVRTKVKLEDEASFFLFCISCGD